MKPFLWLMAGLLLGVGGSWLFRASAPVAPPVPSAAAPRPAPAPIDERLVAPPPATRPAPDYRLHGTYVDDKASLAWIGLAGSASYRGYRLGDEMPQGERLSAIASNAVTLTAADGSEIKLVMRRGGDPAGEPTTIRPAADPQQAFAHMRAQRGLGSGERRSNFRHRQHRPSASEARGATALEPAPEPGPGPGPGSDAETVDLTHP